MKNPSRPEEEPARGCLNLTNVNDQPVGSSGNHIDNFVRCQVVSSRNRVADGAKRSGRSAIGKNGGGVTRSNNRKQAFLIVGRVRERDEGVGSIAPNDEVMIRVAQRIILVVTCQLLRQRESRSAVRDVIIEAGNFLQFLRLRKTALVFLRTNRHRRECKQTN